MRGCDYVVHLAAMNSIAEFKDDLKANYMTNVDGFLNVINAAHENGCKKFVYASSASIYFDDFSETALVDVKKQRKHYAKTKLMNEMIADSYADVHKMKTLGLRYFNVYGPGEEAKGSYACAPTQFTLAKRRGEKIIIFGDGRQEKDFIYVTDVAKITMLLLENGETGVFNVGSGTATSFNYIADLIDSSIKQYVTNPLETYQYLTKADMGKTLSAIGPYKFVTIEEGIRNLKAHLLK